MIKAVQPARDTSLADVYYDKTSISDVNFAKGTFSLRGLPAAELAKQQDFEDVVALLINQSMPGEAESLAIKSQMADNRLLSPQIIDMLRHMTALPADVALRTIISSLSHNSDGKSFSDWDLVALMPSIIVAHNELRSNVEATEPNKELDLASDFLARLLRRSVSDLERRVINLDFILRAEQGANASSLAARIAASTDSDTCSAISAALATFAGHRHGGEEACGAKIIDKLSGPEEACDLAKLVRTDSSLLIGFSDSGHEADDPRTALLRQAAKDLSNEKKDRTLFDAFQALVEELASFGLNPKANVYASIVYRQLGVPADLWIATFAAARSAGWIAHIREQRENNILIRPRLTFVEQ